MTGSSSSQRVKITLTLCVEKIDFDVETCHLRVSGRNVRDHKYVKRGAYHTVDLAKGRQFTLEKPYWDSISRNMLQQACDPTASADLGAVIMDQGIASVCLVTKTMTLVRQKIDKAIPRKRSGYTSHEKAVSRFHWQVADAIVKHFDFDVVKAVIVASPGFVKDTFLEYMFAEAERVEEWRVLLNNRHKFYPCHASSGHKYSLKEVLSDKNVQAKLGDVKAYEEVEAMNDWNTMFNTSPDQAFFGYEEVKLAHDAGAIETLLILDSLFRTKDAATRRKLVNLVEGVQEKGGVVKMFSAQHPSGEQLGGLTGIAAVLRYPMPLPDMSDSETASDEQ